MTGAKTSPLARMIDRLALHSRLSVEDRAALLELPNASRTFEAGSYLLREGDVPDRCHLLVSGLACGQKLGGEGQRQIVSIHIPGDVFDLQHLYLRTADQSVRTLARSEVVSIPHAALLEVVATRPSVAHAMVASMLMELAVAREWMLNIGRRDARTRTAHMLCELAVRFGEQGVAAQLSYELPMTQEQIGDAVGLTSVHINRTLKGLAHDGLVIHNKYGVVIADWERLVRVADFDSRYLNSGIHFDFAPSR